MMTCQQKLQLLNPASSPGPSEKSVDDDSESGIKGRKRKRSKGEVVEQVVKKVMKTVTEGMKECDRMFMEMEEKRMQFEEQQKREERQFQLQLMQMIFGRSLSPHHPPGRTPPPPPPTDHYSGYMYPSAFSSQPSQSHSRYFFRDNLDPRGIVQPSHYSFPQSGEDSGSAAQPTHHSISFPQTGDHEDEP